MNSIYKKKKLKLAKIWYKLKMLMINEPILYGIWNIILHFFIFIFLKGRNLVHLSSFYKISNQLCGVGTKKFLVSLKMTCRTYVPLYNNCLVFSIRQIYYFLCRSNDNLYQFISIFNIFF